MSRERSKVPHTPIVVDGVYLAEMRVVKEPPSFAAIPQRERLLDIYCPHGHMFAVIPKPPVDGTKVLFSAGDDGIRPMLVLLEDGFAGAMVALEKEGRSVVYAIGGPLPSFLVLCMHCSEDYTVIFDDVAKKLAVSGRKKELHLGGSGTGTAFV